MAKLYYQGHGSYRFTTDAGEVIYVDPYVGEGYDIPADLVIVTHEHFDHNKVELVTLKEGGEIWRACDLLVNGEYITKTKGTFTVRAVEAYNKNHKKEECIGFVIELDGKKVYCSGDTDTTEHMSTLLPSMELDWAILCTDGEYNMSVEEASSCAKIIGAKKSIPIHTHVGELYDPAIAEKFECKSRVLIVPNDEIVL
ncbi:MAG: MBL fold metallo-hydrolase [Oscillospiraceae bacterium]|nr:MBL fold metallo-hydrolase [Oscillospiraceae bacterium]